MNDLNPISNLVYRVFLLAWIFAVLWVKEYFWWTFTIATLLFLTDVMILPMIVGSRTFEIRPPTGAPSPIPSSGSGDGSEPDVWREPKPPRSSTRSKKT
jgi:hypothetical protein